MRKVFPLLTLMLATAASFAQVVHSNHMAVAPFKKNKLQEVSVVASYTPSGVAAAMAQANAAGNRSVTSTKVGSAGNAFTMLNGSTVPIIADSTLNTIAFIHRGDPDSVGAATNIGMYYFDKSTDGGASWSKNYGPLNPSATGSAGNHCARYPQAAFHNPAGNTVPDSMYIAYSGTYHIDGDWDGFSRGAGQLGGGTASYKEAFDQVNTGKVTLGYSMCKGAPGVFWNVSFADPATDGAATPYEGIVVMKGIWNATTKNVDWTENIINVPFETTTTTAGSTISAAFNLQIAFDESGQNGWIVVYGDITPDNDHNAQPIVWNTTDGGNTWSNWGEIKLNNTPNIINSLVTIVDANNVEHHTASAIGDGPIAVDMDGNVHMFMLACNGLGEENTDPASFYNFFPADMQIFDFHYDGCGWQAEPLGRQFTFSDDAMFSSNGQSAGQDNRPEISFSPDRTKLFFYWLDSDTNITVPTGAPFDNIAPNLMGLGVDVVNRTKTVVKNFTEGDAIWGGETLNSAAGSFENVMLSAGSPATLHNGSVYNTPFVFTRVDYKNPVVPGAALLADNAAEFYAIGGIDFNESDFGGTWAVDSLGDIYPPVITLNGNDTITQLAGLPYNDGGATSFDCVDGDLTSTINTSSTVNINAAGEYTVTYISCDAAGNCDTVVRVVIIGAVPVANFSFSMPQQPNKVQFQDLSTNNPTSRFWQFGNGGTSTAVNPLYTYLAIGTFNVCLTASNQFGSDSVCKDVAITSIGNGINDPSFAQSISLYPNPATSNVRIEMESNSDITVSIVNMLGEKVSSDVTFKANTQLMNMDISNLNSGVYFVKIQNGTQVGIKPLTVKK